MNTASSRVLQDTNVVRDIMDFDGTSGYLFLASVSKNWRYTWGSKDRTTAFVDPDRTCKQLRETFREFVLNDPKPGSAKSRRRRNPVTRAAFIGRLDLVECLHNIGFEVDAMPCIMAASRGDVGMIKWLRESGYPWNWHVPSAAARRGQLEILEYARDNGCPWNVGVVETAVEFGSYNVLEWAKKRDLPGCDKLCRTACERGNAGVLDWTVLSGYDRWDANYGRLAVGYGHLSVTKWVFLKTQSLPTWTYVWSVLRIEKDVLAFSRPSENDRYVERIHGEEPSRKRLGVLRWIFGRGPDHGLTTGETVGAFRDLCQSRSLRYVDWLFGLEGTRCVPDALGCVELAIEGDGKNLTEGYNDFQLRETLEWMSENFTCVEALGAVEVELVNIDSRL